MEWYYSSRRQHREFTLSSAFEGTVRIEIKKRYIVNAPLGKEVICKTTHIDHPSKNLTNSRTNSYNASQISVYCYLLHEEDFE